ncbi:interleukin-17 receptor C-like isoform X2 [Myxocyprinus asiaticus]|nr:interleukin-17 receptor C-like isoform X2 [Myxocyprinus asiaticus]
MCYKSPSYSDSNVLHFTFSSSAFEDSTTLKVWMSLLVEIREADLGSPVVVYSSYTNSTKQVIIPAKEEVCSSLDVVFCNVGPKLRRTTEHVTGVVKLYVADEDKERFREFQACQKLEREGGCVKVEWNDARNEFEISLSSVAPCLCFEIWGDFPRQEFCPFLNETAISSSNVSLSVAETAAHNKATGKDTTALIWNVSAPCRLHTELWLCRKDLAPSGSCHQINNTLHVHHQNDRWSNTERRFWQLQGEFLEVERHPSLCVQVKVKEMDGYLGPVCPFEVKRTHWSFPLLVCVMLMCLSVLGAYAVQGTLKNWVFRWLKVDDLNNGVGGVEVLLVYLPDADDSVTEQVCRLSSSLSTLGFTVSLDLWGCSELNAMGPVPWLHSRLEHVQRCGGKAVLVLTPAACERAEEWSCQGAGKNLKEDKMKKVSRPITSSDVFSALLSCILTDYLLGRAGERFVLAEFEAQPPGSRGVEAVLPEFFRGLSLFSLPSESLGFLMELTHRAHKGQSAAGRWIRARALKAASQALSGALFDLIGHTCEGHVKSGTEDASESVPLQPN